LNTAFAAMKKLRLKDPYVTETDNSINVHIEHTPLASPEEMVLEYLHMHDTVTNRITRNLTGITSENSMKTVFLNLKKRNIIDRVPDLKGNKAAWQKVKKWPSPAWAYSSTCGPPCPDSSHSSH
jgi:ATP-dependent DNA helicase RecG